MSHRSRLTAELALKVSAQVLVISINSAWILITSALPVFSHRCNEIAYFHFAYDSITVSWFFFFCRCTEHLMLIGDLDPEQGGERDVYQD